MSSAEDLPDKERLSKSIAAVGAFAAILTSVVGLVVSMAALGLSRSEAAEAKPQVSGAVWRGVGDVDLEYAAIADPVPDAPKQLIGTFHLSNSGRNPTSLVGARVDGVQIPGSEFQAVDGTGRPLSSWNSPIVLGGGEAVIVLVRSYVWPEICSEDTLNRCPNITLEFIDDVTVDLDTFATEESCRESEHNTAKCLLLSNAADSAFQESLSSYESCVGLVAEIDRKWEIPANLDTNESEARLKQICANYRE